MATEREVSRRAKVLLVDDDERNRALLRAMLRETYETIDAASAEVALEILEREPVDLVLMDVMMPQITGYEACKLIKQRHHDPFLPVLLVTALSDQDNKNVGLQAGADDFLAKPVDRRELLLRVQAFLRLRAQDVQIRAQVEKLGRLQAAKDELLSLMVHDLRSPLSGVVAHLQLVIGELPSGEIREDAEAALSGAVAISSALEEALQIRLLEEGHLPIKRTPVDLTRLLADAVGTLRPLARRKSIGLSTTIEGAAVASLDAKLVRRAIENLVSNAIKYTPEGKDISIVLRHLEETIELDVADRGPGIPAALKASMFEKFGSVEAKEGAPRKGIGLGLYLVKLVAEGHAGAAQVLDRQGGGAVFRVSLATRSA
jgi:signal transduction histidine kinase